MGESSNVVASLLDIDESSGAMEELLQREPVPSGVLVRLAAWEAGNLWRISWASILITLSSFTLSLVTQMFVGHLGELELAGASITNIGIQGLAYGVMIGMASAVQTVCGQAYGARRYAAMGVVCQRALVLQLTTAIPIAFLYWYAGPFLRLIGQETEVATAGQLYARGLLPQLFAFALFCPMQRFLQAQNIVNPVAYITLAVLIFHTLASWLAVFVLGSGLLGAALTLSFSWWVLVVLTWGYLIWSPACKGTWTGLSLLAFRGLWGYAKLAFASAVMLALEIWYVQGFVLLTGFLPNSEIALDSLSICINYWNWDFQIMLGLSYAASIRVGNELGAGHPKVARFSVIMVVMASISFSVLVTFIVVILRYPLSTLYTSSTTIIEAVISLMPLLAISIFLNGIQPILSGVAIGSGWQAIVAYVNVGAYYLIGLPIGCVLGYKTSLGAAVTSSMPPLCLCVQGIWWGLIIGVSVQTIALIIITARTNWDKEVEKAMQRLCRTGVVPVNDIIA
ncbi:protein DETOXIFICATION 41 isoform X1 [Phragmites australis]|uniref:protein DETOXIFICATION 41 isoform X1 n=1 Tax=Phragmites australis TaxID=29695 RepID=UPI002D770AB6|nr:protein DETOXIFICATION 41 isoform X1 [Phragmites australis]